MNTELSAEAELFGTSAVRAIGEAGGHELVRRAETDWSVHTQAELILQRLGVWDLEPAKSADDLEAAAMTCRAAGQFALPYPVAERLAAGPQRPGTQAIAVAIIDGPQPRINMACAELGWVALDGHGRCADVISIGKPLASKLATFASPVEHGPWTGGNECAPLYLTLQAWVLLGMLTRAARITYDYVRVRHQFGRPLASFQHVQFQLTDVATSITSLEELAKYTLWSLTANLATAHADAVALRLAAIESAEVVFRVCHQMHGAIGFCDESDLSWLSRHSQPLRRLPWGRSRTEEVFEALLGIQPFASLYPADIEAAASPGADE